MEVEEHAGREPEGEEYVDGEEFFVFSFYVER